MDPIVLLWAHLKVLTKRRRDFLLERYGDLRAAAACLGGELLRELGCKDETVPGLLEKLRTFDPAAEERELRSRNIDVVTMDDECYPRRLREIADPPVCLYYRGDLGILDEPTVAMVGTRNMRIYGRRSTEFFVPPFVRAGVVTVSGLARGVDWTVAEETLRAKGRTVAVLGHGIDLLKEEGKENLAGRIVAAGGLILSEYPLRFPGGTYTYPERNRIIAGLSLCTVVLEAPHESGALITAEQAFGYDRLVFAVPGQIFDDHYDGCHDLIARDIAEIALSPEQVLRALKMIPGAPEQRACYQAATLEEGSIYALLTAMPQSVDELVERAGFDASIVGTALTMMELGGAAKNVGSGMWVRA